MRLCRIGPSDRPQVAFYHESRIVPLMVASLAQSRQLGHTALIYPSTDLLDFLPGGAHYQSVLDLYEWVELQQHLPGCLDTGEVELLVPIPRPNKLLLLAGNYAEHVIERGGTVAERTETYPYVFMKPPSTTLTAPNQPLVIPKISPDAIDWECELAVVIGKRCKNVPEADALKVVAGYTILNDISNRKFRPNPNRKKRERDVFFDWLHGKWHDSFCPMGPCVVSSQFVEDPQSLGVKLFLNGETKQNGSTGQMIFPVAAIIEFISSMMTLEPGDIISTGTPSGVGSATGTFLKPGDLLQARIDGLGVLNTPVIGE
jgi:2-keto-4-pentenoate hydratase/2-oxohepta-3-ene-1,7-dioic acid hydratase in catechol pathway